MVEVIQIAHTHRKAAGKWIHVLVDCSRHSKNCNAKKPNPRRAGGLYFLCRAGGGERFHAPPLTRLLGHVAKRGKWQSKERQK